MDDLNGSSLSRAMQRRGMGMPTPALNQVSSSAPSYQGAQPVAPVQGGGGMPTPQGGAQPAPAAADPETQKIVDTLSTRLKDLTKMGR